LKRGGRQRNLDQRAEEIRTGLRTEQLTAPDPVTAAFAATTKATIGILKQLNQQIDDLETVLADRFEQHPDADIYLSMPGLGDVLGARALANSETIRTVMPTPSLARTMRERRPSPLHQAKRRPSSPGTSVTGGCMTPSTNGPSAH
jgi:hypothetical protein